MSKTPQFIVLQLDMAKHPRSTVSLHHTGQGVLFPVSADGFYSSQTDAVAVAEFIASEHPRLRTLVVQVVEVTHE